MAETGWRARLRKEVDASPGASDEARVNCPFCLKKVGKSDTSQTLSVNRYSGQFYCYRCESRGTLNGDGQRRWVIPEDEPEVTLPEDYSPLFVANGFLTKAPEAYLLGRNLSRETAKAAKIGASFSGRYAGRIIIPVETAGKLRGFIARTWGKAEPKYLYSQGNWRKSTLYNQDALYLETSSPVLIVEGALDALAVGEQGVAALGHVSGALDLCRCAKRPVVFVADGDDALAALAAANQLRLLGVKAGAVRLAAKQDPDEVDRDLLLAAALRSIDVQDWEDSLDGRRTTKRAWGFTQQEG